jgi:hypothetical protein
MGEGLKALEQGMKKVDQFRDFEQRGLAFRQEAVKLVKRRSPTEPA